MKPLDNTMMAFRVICSLVFSGVTLATLTGTAAAETIVPVDFCKTTDYDNANSQTFGLFTDVTIPQGNPLASPGPAINSTNSLSPSTYPSACGLHLYGSSGANKAEMFVTLIGGPPTPIVRSCWTLETTIFYQTENGKGWDNARAMGIVTNYNNGKGLFFGLYNAGNTERLALDYFDLNTIGNTNSIPELAAKTDGGGSCSIAEFGCAADWIRNGDENTMAPQYVLTLDICSANVPNPTSGGGSVYVTMKGSVRNLNYASPVFTCPSRSVNTASNFEVCLTYNDWPPAAAGIQATGAAGLGGLSPGGGWVNTYVSKFVGVPSTNAD